MDLHTIALAAVSGLVGAAVAAFAFRNKPESGTGFTIVFLVVTVSLMTVGRNFLLPVLVDGQSNSHLERRIEDFPAVKTLKEREPVAYQELIETLSDYQRSGIREHELIPVFRKHFINLIELRLPYSSDKAVRQFTKIIVDQIEELQTYQGDVCFLFLFPQAGDPVHFPDLLSSKTKEEEASVHQLIIATYDSERAIPTAEATWPLLEPVYLDLSEQYGEDLSILENPTGTDVDRELVCEITQSLYSDILDLEPSSAAQVMRWLFASEVKSSGQTRPTRELESD